MFRSLLSALGLALVGSAPALAQPGSGAPAANGTAPPAPNTSRAAWEAPKHAAEENSPLSCLTLTGQVMDENGRALVGAAVALAGSHEFSSTNFEGYYRLAVPVQMQQVLRIGAAGYAEQLVPVTQCNQPAVTLHPLPGTRLKQGKRHYGKIVEIAPPTLEGK